MKKIANFRYLPAIALAVIAGILSSSFGKPFFSLTLIIISAVLISCFLIIQRNKKKQTKAIILLLAFFVSLICTMNCFWKFQDKAIRYNGVEIEGRLSTANAFDENGFCENNGGSKGVGNIVLIEVEKIKGEKYKGVVELQIEYFLLSDVKVGSKIKVKADIVSKPLDVVGGNMTAFNRKHFWTATFRGDLENSLEIIDKKINIFDTIKVNTRQYLLKNVNENTANFLYAMTFGDSQYLDDNTKSDFRVTGTAHLFAVSGLHIGILAGALLIILRKLRIKEFGILVIEGLFLFGYSFLCGFAPSTLRASFMFLILQSARCLGRRNDPFSTISLSAIVILICSPMSLFDIGFQLSFGAVLGILFLSPQISRLLSKIMPKKLAGLLGVSFAVNLGFFPMAMAYFGTVPSIFVLANLLVIPWVELFYPIYFFAMVATLCIPPLQATLYFVSFAFVGMIEFVKICADVSTFVFQMPMPTWTFLPWIVGIFLLSDLSFINIASKRMTSVVLVGIIIVNSVLLIGGFGYGMGKNKIFCYSDSYENQYALIKSYKYGNYLLLGEDTSFDGLRQTEKILSKYSIKHLDGVVKAEFSAKNIDFVSTGLKLQIDALYAFWYCPEARKLPIERKGTAMINEWASVFIFNILQYIFVIDGISICILSGDDGQPYLRDFDIILTTNSEIVIFPNQIAVCESGYRQSRKNFVSSDFTFNIENGIILENPFWRKNESAGN